MSYLWRTTTTWLLIAAFAGVHPGAGQQFQQNDSDVERTVKLSASPDPDVSAEAKAKLMQMGRAAAPALLKAMRTWNDTRNEPASIEEAEALDRLQNSIYELVGKLRLEEAIPLLINDMELRSRDNAEERCRPDIKALVAIGPAAVAPLISSLQNAGATSERNRKTYFFSSVTSGSIQLRAAGALGDLGDISALPVMESRLRELKDANLWEAVQLLKKKNGMKYGQWPVGHDPERFCRD